MAQRVKFVKDNKYANLVVGLETRILFFSTFLRPGNILLLMSRVAFRKVQIMQGRLKNCPHTE